MFFMLSSAETKIYLVHINVKRHLLKVILTFISSFKSILAIAVSMSSLEFMLS